MLPILAAIAVPLFAHHIKATPEEVIPVNVSLRYITEIDFPKGKDTQIVSTGDARPKYGDPKFWDVKTDGSALFILPQDEPPPTGGGRSTNIAITLVDGRRFQIYAHEISRDKNARPDLRVIADLDDRDDRRAEFIRMDDHFAQLAALQTENLVLHKTCEPAPKPAIPAALQSAEVDTLNDLHFFDYVIDSVKGKGKDFRTVIFHNDRFTFIAADGLDLPTVSALHGKDYVKVQTTWVRNRYEMPLVEDGMIQSGKDSFKFHLRSKK
jgi:hypothetical protein